MSSLSGTSFIFFLVVVLLLVVVGFFLVRHTYRTTRNKHISQQNIIIQGVIFIAISGWVLYNGVYAIRQFVGFNSFKTVFLVMSIGEICLGILALVCGILLLLKGINKRKAREQ